MVGKTVPSQIVQGEELLRVYTALFLVGLMGGLVQLTVDLVKEARDADLSRLALVIFINTENALR